jgi:cell division septation protein DedD
LPLLLKIVFSADKTGVMQRIFALDEPPVRPPAVEADSEEEFELVVGRRQVAGILFLALVVVAVFSGGSYLAGKATSARVEPAEQEIQLEQPPAPSAVPVQAPMIEATIVPASAVVKPAADAPLFANPNPQAIYIQVGAVEKGVALILAEGLRKHALDSFVAPGPGTKSYRVLIGPFADAEAYQRARNIVADIGLDNFARRYQPE